MATTHVASDAASNAASNATPLFTVTKGHLSEDELAALTAVIADLQAEQTAQAAAQNPADRNGWGAPRPSHHQGAVYNPHAFGNVAYF